MCVPVYTMQACTQFQYSIYTYIHILQNSKDTYTATTKIFLWLLLQLQMLICLSHFIYIQSFVSLKTLACRQLWTLYVMSKQR